MGAFTGSCVTVICERLTFCTQMTYRRTRTGVDGRYPLSNAARRELYLVNYATRQLIGRTEEEHCEETWRRIDAEQHEGTQTARG
ncbi:Seed biotin-containing protein [Trichinella pseudospiralis]